MWYSFKHNMPKMKEAVTINLDKKTIEWIDAQVNQGKFENRSAGIRSCVKIAKRIFESNDNDAKVKYILGD